MSTDIYQDNILDHYRNPRNRGHLDHPHATYEDVNPLCGDTIRMDIEFAPALPGEPVTEQRIKEVRFSGRGCSISQAAASMLTEMVSGQTVTAARAVDKDDLLEELGISLSPTRLKCALLCLKTFKMALYSGLSDQAAP